MTALDVEAARVRAAARKVELPKLSTLLVALIGLIPFLLAWGVRAVAEFASLLVASWTHGWNTAGRQLGGTPPSAGGS